LDIMATEEVIQAMKEELKGQLEALDSDQLENLQGLLICATVPEAPKKVTFPRNMVMDDNLFPQFMTWYLEENGVTLKPVFDMRDPNFIVMEFI